MRKIKILFNSSSNLFEKDNGYSFDDITYEEKAEFHLKNSVFTEIKIISNEILYSAILKTNFEKRSHDKFTSYAWINKSKINYKDKEHTKLNGFEIIEKLDFIVGNLFTEDFVEDDNLEDTEYEYILCKIIL